VSHWAGYVLDTSALVGGWTRHYPPDLFPRLWDQLDQLCEEGRVVIPEEVLRELEAKDDGLFAWVKARENRAVLPTSVEVLTAVREILAATPFLTKTGPGRDRADPFVIAVAQEMSLPVVTEEQGGSTKKPKIPFVCEVRDVACLRLLDLIRAESWTF
jgi:Domain of unknown function (DUF4411)